MGKPGAKATITDIDVAKLFRRVESYMSKYHPVSEDLPTQVSRGADPAWDKQEPGGCNRYHAIFRQSSIIPEFCFGCYKIVIELRTVVEFFKLMMVFDELDLPNKNYRKCMIEIRQDVSGRYKGFIYALSLEDATSTHATISELIEQRIGSGIPVKIKRGCSEFSLVYPDYSRVEDGKTFFEFQPGWKQLEESAVEHVNVNMNEKAQGSKEEDKIDSYSLNDYKAMLLWLAYAAKVGDESYLQVSPVVGGPLQGAISSNP